MCFKVKLLDIIKNALFKNIFKCVKKHILPSHESVLLYTLIWSALQMCIQYKFN